ncbi:hypothetical protein FGW37_17350 [Streptomyces rectiverticillatus]|nr:hypothetical protein FGW37_17350 [Streptomyces rectiverticillatus]
MRRKTIVSASASAAAAALALGSVLAGCGGTDRDAYVASEAAGPGSSSHPVGGAVPPDEGVEFHPLPAAPPSGRSPGRSPGSSVPGSSRPPASSRPQPPQSPQPPPSPLPPSSGISSPQGAGSPPRTASPASPAKPSPPSSPSPPSRPGQPSHTPEAARLETGEPHRSADDEGRRWCEKVTVPLANSGGSPVTTGTVTFGSHVIDLLGLDWSTITSSQPLPVPIEAGATVEGAWTVCVDAWRVPWGMHVETRDVKVEWG